MRRPCPQRGERYITSDVVERLDFICLQTIEWIRIHGEALDTDIPVRGWQVRTSLQAQAGSWQWLMAL
jgi:hypothetical protein